MNKQAKKTKGKKPLTISIHGEDLDIEATFQDKSQLNQVLTELIARMRGAMKPSKQTAPRAPFAELLAEFVSSLSIEQINTLQAALSTEQKILFLEILKTVQPREDQHSEARTQAS